MIRTWILVGCAALGLSACLEVEPAQERPSPQTETEVTKRPGSPQTVADFRVVVRRVEPVAERVCRQMRPELNCDFDIGIDTKPNQPPNAYQTYSESGQPIIRFTPALFKEMRNRDELAFALSHEAAHHIRGHIEKTQKTAMTGAIIGAVLGAAVGLDQAGLDVATNLGGTVGARRYSKDFELQADSLGARIAERAGYDALRGVQYFMSARDPGDQFLGTHPPNNDRIKVVEQTVGN